MTPKVTERFQGDSLQFGGEWQHIELYTEKIRSDFEANFLNYQKTLDLPSDWNNEKPSKLWVYNLHYFEEFLSENASQKEQFHQDLFNLWIDQNPVGLGIGWEAYPLL